MFVAQARDWTVQGVEIGQDIARWGQKYLHMPIHIGSVEDAALQAESFDVVVAIEVLEHVIDPRAFVNLLYHYLRPGGMFFITTPNVYSSYYYPPQAETAILEPADHLNLFSVDTLTILFREFRFEKLVVEADGPGGFQLQVFAQKPTGRH